MVAVPTFFAVTTPFETVAIVWSEELHVTVLSVASDGFTVAVSVTVSPALSDAVVLFSITEVTSVATTVIWHVAVLLPALAVMVAVPTFFAVTTPFKTVAIVWSEELHVTVLSVASDGFTVAVSVTVSPALSDAVVLFSITEVTSVATTVIWHVAVLLPALAVMVAVPTFFAVTTPFKTVAIVWSEELHVTVLSVASDGFTVAVSVTVSPALSDAVVLFSITEVTSVATTVIWHVAVLLPALAVMVTVPTFFAVTTPFETVATV